MTIRLIQVGLGNWGQDWYARIVSQDGDVETVGWVEVDAKALERAREKLKLPQDRCFLTLEEALGKVEADAVLITASLPGHVPSALTALKANLHVLVEKPFARTIAEAQQVVALAEERGRILVVSQNYRFARAARAAAEQVREQVLGRVGSVSLDFRRYANTAPVEGHRHYQLWHPLLVDMSIHHFDLLRLVLGQEPVQVMCKTWNPPWSHFVQPPAAAATITFDGGAVVNYRGSWVSMGPQTNWSGEWRMDCEQGEIVWTGRGEIPDQVTLRPLDKPERSLKLAELAYVDRAGSLHSFVEAVRTGKTPETSGRDNLKTLALMYACIESAETGLPVNI